jgi:hypothetical protein
MAKKIIRWAAKRAKERSTYAGLGVIATLLGAQKLGMQIDHLGQAVALIAGSGLMAATTQD